jgi:hypothetical protein
MTVSKEKGVQKVVRKGGELGEPGQGEKIIPSFWLGGCS